MVSEVTQQEGVTRGGQNLAFLFTEASHTSLRLGYWPSSRQEAQLGKRWHHRLHADSGLLYSEAKM